MLLPRQRRMLGSKRRVILIGFLCLVSSLIRAQAPGAKDVGAGLEYVTPEAVGWSSQKLEEAKAFAEKIHSAAVMLLYDGKVFISWGKVMVYLYRYDTDGEYQSAAGMYSGFTRKGSVRSKYRNV